MLVVGDRATLQGPRPHRRARPGRRRCSSARGEVSRLDVADMREQVAERAARLGGRRRRAPRGHAGVRASWRSSTATGWRAVPRARRVRGRRRRDDEPVDLRPARRRSTPPAPREAIVLPNSPNVILAAERAAELSEKPARVVPTRSQQEGLLRARRVRPVDARGARTPRGAPRPRRELATGGVAPRRARTTRQGRFRGRRRASATRARTWSPGATRARRSRAVLGAVGERRRGRHLIAGDGRAARRRRDRARSCRTAPSSSYHAGGQAGWWWLVAAE